MNKKRLFGGTLNEGIIYNKGVILLADSLVTFEDEKYCSIQKIVSLAENLGMAAAGSLGQAQHDSQTLQNIIKSAEDSYSPLIEKEEKKVMEKIKKSKIKKDGNEDLRLTKQQKEKIFSYPEAYLISEADDTRLDPNISYDLSGTKKYPLNSLVVQCDGLQHFFETRSVATYMRQIMGPTRDKVSSYILAGYDKSGPSLFEIYSDGGIIEKRDYATNGSGYLEAKVRLNDYYQKDLSRNDALKLAVFVGLKVSEEVCSINDSFQILVIEKDEKIKSSMLKKEEIEDLKNQTRAARIKFPF